MVSLWPWQKGSWNYSYLVVNEFKHFIQNWVTIRKEEGFKNKLVTCNEKTFLLYCKKKKNAVRTYEINQLHISSCNPSPFFSWIMTKKEEPDIWKSKWNVLQLNCKLTTFSQVDKGHTLRKPLKTFDARNYWGQFLF